MEKINLSKGGSINLSKRYSGETKYRVGLAWDLKSGQDADLDALVLELDSSRKCLGVDYLVGYPSGDPGRSGRDKITFEAAPGKLGFKDPEGAVKHYGDARTATASVNGDDEVIEIDLSRLRPEVAEILVIVSVYEPEVGFDKIGCPMVSVYKGTSEISDLSYDLDESFPGSRVVEVASIKKVGGTWELQAIGNGAPELGSEIARYGL